MNKRTYLPTEFKITTWNKLKEYFDEIQSREVSSLTEYKKYLLDKSELEAIVSEDFAWRYIKMTCNTIDPVLQEAYQDFVQNIQPHLAIYSDTLNKKTLELAKNWPFNEDGYAIMLRGLDESVKIFKEENIPLFTEIQLKQAEYQNITGEMTIEFDGEEMTLPKAASFLLKPDRSLRENIWREISKRRYSDKDKLNQNFSDLLNLRHEVATNAGFKNFRDYMFTAMGRYDYTPEDCFKFHNAIEKVVVPIVNRLENQRKNELGNSDYRPWDSKVDTKGKAPLKPFENGKDLLDKSEQCFKTIDPRFAEYISTMRKMGHFDVESRKGKAPGGYNYPLEETGVPFIFMNATGTTRDMVTMVHEGGHAIHSFQVRDLPLNAYRNPPMEVAELASMSMELISMEHWDAYFETTEDLYRAKREHLQDILGTLPWIATVDKYQHWIYENPSHSLQERSDKWLEIFTTFSDSVTNWKDLEEHKKYIWQKQLHIFEVPFYYIEYGMAQLGAISIWKNYRENPEKGLEKYLNALKLGYTKNIREIYDTAGIRFDFSESYISELMQFVENELDKVV